MTHPLEDENRRLIEALATALRHLEKGRALWNGPCHQCAYVLRDALGMGEQSTAPPPPPMQGEEETAKLLAQTPASWKGIAAALRQRADEATEACANNPLMTTISLAGLEGELRRRAASENEACATLQIGSGVPATNESASVFANGFRIALEMYRAAIRARITPP